MALSTLTPAGVDAFDELLADASALSPPELRERVGAIAANPKLVRVADGSCQVRPFQSLGSRGDVATATENLPIEQFGPDAYEPDGVFSWLALVWLPALCAFEADRYKVGQRARYLASRQSGEFYRHLVAGPYWLRRRHGRLARLFECQPAHRLPDVVEQVASRPWLVDSDGVIMLLDQLYWDEASGAPKNGFTSTERFEEPLPGRGKSSPRPGTLRALDLVLGQVECTYDLRSMTADQIQRMLTPEFDDWLS